MREHQIVISLKPEQFQEVQKQARAAGAQSVGAFVRQNLLIFLGLEEADAAKKSSRIADAVQADPDWRFIAGELRRLHRELKVLASEATVSTTLLTDLSGSTKGPMLASSVGLSDFNERIGDEQTDYKQPAAQENFLTDGAPVSADDYPDDFEDSLILPPAHGTGGGTVPFFQTPTIPTRSPFGLPMPAGQLPLSSPFSQHAFMPNITPLPSDLGTSIPATGSLPAETPTEAAPEPAPRQVFTVEEGDPVETTKISAFPTEPQPLAQPAAPQIKSDAPENAPSTAPIPAQQPTPPIDLTAASAPASEGPAAPLAPQAAQPVSQSTPPPAPPEPVSPVPPIDPTINAAPIAQHQPPPPQLTATPTASDSQTAFAPQKDDMEVLADRAFAISPRLGAIEPEVTLQPAPSRSFADTLEELLDAGLINQVLGPGEDPADEYAGEVEAPPEDDMVQVIVQEVDVPSDDATDSESSATADNKSDSEEEESESPPARVIDYDPPPPPKPIGADDETNEDDPPKPPPRRKKLM